MENDIEYCFICKKELEFWHTSLKKYDGKKACSDCATKMEMKNLREAIGQADNSSTGNHKTQDLGRRVTNLGKKLTVGLTYPIILFVIGLFTLPFGVIFWILAVMLFATLFIHQK
jgi:hypothetical protein